MHKYAATFISNYLLIQRSLVSDRHMEGRTEGWTDRWTDRRVGRNSDLDTAHSIPETHEFEFPVKTVFAIDYSLQARKWFKLDYGVHQKWMGGMKLGTLVYEKSGKSKSNNAPFVGTIRLHLAGIL